MSDFQTGFAGKSILSLDQFSRKDVEKVLDLALLLEPVASRKRRFSLLRGAIAANLFFEPSTRTRLSFAAAFLRLGGGLINTTGFTFSSLAKGESLEDSARVIAGYADVIVLRHPEEGSVSRFANALAIPVINAGDGSGEHPTQALLDLLTAREELATHSKELSGLTVTFLGDLRYGRTVHSLIKLLTLYPSMRFRLAAPRALQLPETLVRHARSLGHQVEEVENLKEALVGSDLLYATRIQRERLNQGESESLRGAEAFRLSREAIRSFAPDDLIVLHPLPRDSSPEAIDLTDELDQDPRIAIFRQTDKGISLRMALFVLVLGMEERVDSALASAPTVDWFVPESYRKS